MTERGKNYVIQRIKNFFDEKFPDLPGDQTENMAREVVDAIDWENSALMHKGLRWIAEEVYREKINKRFEEINSRPAERLTEEEAASLAEAEAINDGTTVELHELIKFLEGEIDCDFNTRTVALFQIEGFIMGIIIGSIKACLAETELSYFELIRRFRAVGLDGIVTALVDPSKGAFLLGLDEGADGYDFSNAVKNPYKKELRQS